MESSKHPVQFRIDTGEDEATVFVLKERLEENSMYKEYSKIVLTISELRELLAHLNAKTPL